jgi:ribose-phosphate pyrophosphokinase
MVYRVAGIHGGVINYSLVYPTTLMKTINTITKDNVEFIHYPDNQPSVIVKNVEYGDTVSVVTSLKTCNDAVRLLQITESIRSLEAVPFELYIKYLMAARSDRRFNKGQSFDLQVMSDLINHCGYPNVFILDPHSSESTKLILNSVAIAPTDLYQAYDKEKAVVIYPDIGASIRHDLSKSNPNFKDSLFSSKLRDGQGRVVKLTLHPNPRICINRNVVIVDDLCDGGATFINIAKQLEDIPMQSLSLMVTHGVFSKGVELLLNYFTDIYTTDSYTTEQHSKLHITHV